MADQDPLIDARSDEDGQVVVSLYGRVQQEVLAATLAEEFGVQAEFSDASVIHVERPRGIGAAVERFNTPSNPHHATLGLRIAPGAPGSGLVFDVAVSGTEMPLFLYRSAEGFSTVMRRHVAHALDHGLFGWHVTDCRVTVTDIAYTSADGPPSRRGPLPSAHDFRKLTPLVLRQALLRAGVRVCEPVLEVALEVPTDEHDLAPAPAGTLGCRAHGPDLSRRLRHAAGAAPGGPAPRAPAPASRPDRGRGSARVAVRRLRAGARPSTGASGYAVRG